MVSNKKECKTGQEHQGQGANPIVYASTDLAYDGDQHSPHKGSTFSADIINAKVFAGFVCRNDLSEI